MWRRGSAALLAAWVAGCAPVGGRPWEERPWASEVAAPEALPGERPQPIDLATALKLAGANNLQVALLREKVHEAYATAGIAQEKFFPTLRPSVGYGRHEGRLQKVEGAVLDVTRQSVSAGAGLELRVAWGEAVFESLASERRFEASRAGLEATEQAVLLAAAESYLGLLEAAQRGRILAQAVEISQRLETETQAAVDAGRGFRGDVLRARVQRSHNQRALMRAREEERQASIALGTLLRLDPAIELAAAETEVTPMELLDESPIERRLAEAFSARPELTEAQKELEAAQKDLDRITWGPLVPTLVASALAAEFGRTPGALGDREDYAVALEWSIGPGGLLDLAAQDRAEARRRQAEIRLAQARQRVGEEVRRSDARLRARREELQAARQEIADAEEALRLNQERQRLGVGLPLEVLQAEEAVTRGRRDYLGAVTDYNVAQYRLWSAMGRRSGP